jgi:dTDP-4-dehydrorhamnose 3,5-epimerase
MDQVNLTDIRVTPLQRITVSGGDVLHALKATEDGFCGFGEAYFSVIEYGIVKGWKRHTRMYMNIVVPVGMVRFVFYDDKKASFREEMMGVDRYVRLTVPPGIWFAFQGAAAQASYVLNIASIPHDPNEVERLSCSEIHYQWP